jgi:aspartyl-tRNA(Asn)/glutamyl-tRNA(Gln) amidotransferase subunit A
VKIVADTASPASDLHALSIAEAARLIAARHLSPVELARAFLARIEMLDPRINAHLLVTADRALDKARLAEAEIMAGRYRGPLHGIAYTVADAFCIAGSRTTGQSPGVADVVSGEDAHTVARLSDAGAVLLGKLAANEFRHGGAGGDLPWPPAHNPRDLGGTGDGGAAGPAAAVAAGLAVAALGSDSGGGLREPAGSCGLAGLKPSFGLVSRRGILTNSFSYDHAGPICRTVADVAVLLRAIAGHDPSDPSSAAHPVPDYAASLTGDIRGLRIGVLRHQYEEELPVRPVLRDAMDAALETLRGLGALIEDTRLRPLQDFADVQLVGAGCEALAVHDAGLRAKPDLFGQDFLDQVLPAVLLTAEDYVNSQRERRLMMAEASQLWTRYDAIITATAEPVPALGAWDASQVWKQRSLMVPFNVLGWPALALCIGYTTEGSPLAMQVVSRPFGDGTALRIGHAYERVTPWRDARPVPAPGDAGAVAAATRPGPMAAGLSARERDSVALVVRRAGLSLAERDFEHLCAVAPSVDAVAGRLRKSYGFSAQPSNIFRFTGFTSP